MILMKRNNLVIKLVIFSVTSGKLKIFLPEGRLPGGEIEGTGTLDGTAKNILSQALNLHVRDNYLEQLYTFADCGKITVVYYILLPDYRIVINDRNWLNAAKLDRSDPDINIIRYAIQRLRWKIEYTNVVYSLLPSEFTLI